ncbi:hypothetical protein [Brevundimonas sp.]|nr:hypothetical protein [Brevundimonas sp.]
MTSSPRVKWIRVLALIAAVIFCVWAWGSMFDLGRSLFERIF